MKKTNILVMVMLLMGLAFVVNMDTASAASSIYVNVTSGNDAWNGQSQFYTNGTNGPKKTINGGVTVVDANGTVNLADGIYSGNGNNGITIGKNLTIKGQSKDGTIINGSNSNQIFTISSGVNVSLLNITIANAKSSNSGGSAIKNNGGTLTINNCTFKNNNASRTSWSNDIYGGAIYSTGPLTIINSTFINNSAYGQDYIAQGGAIYSTGPLTIIDSTFTNNSALGSGGSNLVVGGAISIQNSLNITRSTFTNNMAGSRVGTEGFGGGALYIGTNTAPIANVSISESNFINNSATYGGAIWMNAGSSTKFATITKCTFVGNDAKNGGAIRNWGYLNLTNSYFTNNTATADGAAIYNYQGALNVNFNQIINDTGNLEIYVNSGAVNATNNWWGSNTNVSSKVSNGVNVSTWLVLLLTRSPQTVLAGYTSTIIADLNHDQNGVYYDPADGHIPDGTPVIFTSTLGTINSAVMINGIATVTFTAGNTPGVATINATVNGYTNSTTVTIVPLATIILYQTVNTPVNVGDKVTFLVTATNNGPNTATNINIRDFIPAGLTGVTVTTSTGTYNSTTGIWTITSLANGSSAVLNITGTASAAMAGKITNNTATEISQTQNTTQLPSSTKGVYTKMADVVMSQTVTTPVNVGDVVTYIVSIINIGPDAATNFIIRDIIPDGLLNVVVTPSTGTYSNGNWTVPFLANGDSTTLTITAVASAAMAGKNTTNTATKIFETEYDPTTIGESVSSDAYTKEADLVVTNTANGDRLNVGEMGTFTVVVTNNGPDDATNIVITNDALPDGFTASWDNGNYENNIWTISSLASGESATITFTCDALYDSYAGTTITNHIEVDLTEYPFTVNVDDSSIYVKMANVAINQTGSYNKNNVTFVVNVKNNGPDNATNILIENTIPEGLTNVVFTPSIGTYDSETGIWTIPLLTNGQVATLTVTGTAVPQSTIFNRISIISQDEYSQDSKKSFGATYLPESDVRVSLYTSTGKYTNWDVNNVVSWVAEIINLGPDDAHDVVVTVLLP
ncbi:MAG: hypothetical protein Q8M97_04015, partial [Methanobacteriaceae archaeon]|nr:hypothetical protein [Methanobacteriaceae archaeon]